MGEIKSTLELIMEKTKGLSMTPEEKEAFRLEEWLKKARGRIQKYLDDLEGVEEIKEEWIRKDNPPRGWEAALKKEILAGLDPDKDEENEKRLRLLKDLLDLPDGPFREAIQAYKDKVTEEARRLEVLERERLKLLGISGSAVLPNPARHPAWKGYYEKERKACRERLAALASGAE